MPHVTRAPRARLAPPRLSLPVDPARFVEVTGERVALLGREDGPFECWIWPFKVLSDLSIQVLRGGMPVTWTRREVTVLPGEVQLAWEAPRLKLRTEVFACHTRPGMAFGFALDSDEPVELEVSFRCDLRPMWPAGLGGQLARIDPVTGALALTEELGRTAALIGASREREARVEYEASDHEMPDGRVRVIVPMQSEGSSSVLAIAGAEADPPRKDAETGESLSQARARMTPTERAVHAARELWFRLVSDFSTEREAIRDHWRGHANRVLSVQTPNPSLDEAFRWSQVALERSWVRVDGLGRGLVAGFGESGRGARPGAAWFKDGEALRAVRAFVLTGDFLAAAELLRFVAGHQREDGRLLDELPLSASMCGWMKRYPQAYRAGAASAELASALELYFRHTGDLDLARELLPAARLGLESCLPALDQEGRLTSDLQSRTRFDEGGEDGEDAAPRITCEAHMQGVWIVGLRAAARLCEALEEDAGIFNDLARRAELAFDSFWSEEHGTYVAGLLPDGAPSEPGAGVAHPLARGLGERVRAWETVQALNGPALMTDWGARTLSSRSPAYAPADRERGAVRPLLTHHVNLAQFAHGHALAAHQVLFSQVALTRLEGLGFLPAALDGEHTLLLPKGISHHVASSAALIESVLLGLFGMEASASEGRVAFRPSLPAGWGEVRLAGVRVGMSTLDVRLYRRREPGATVIGLELELGEGRPLQIGFSPVLPALTKLLDGPGWLRPSGAVVPRRLHRSGGDPLTLEARVLEGPTVRLPAELPGRGAASRAVRLVRQSCEQGAVQWTFTGPAGAHVTLPFACDFDVAVRGASLLTGGELHLTFPEAGAGGGPWTQCEVGVRAR